MNPSVYGLPEGFDCKAVEAAEKIVFMRCDVGGTRHAAVWLNIKLSHHELGFFTGKNRRAEADLFRSRLIFNLAHEFANARQDERIHCADVVHEYLHFGCEIAQPAIAYEAERRIRERPLTRKQTPEEVERESLLEKRLALLTELKAIDGLLNDGSDS